MKKIIFLLLVCVSTALLSDEKTWRQISGKWQVSSTDNVSFLSDLKSNGPKFNYSELINNNSLITSDYYNFDKLVFESEIINSSDESIFAIVVNLRDDYRLFHAFRFVCNDNKIKNIELIQSKIIDQSKSYKIKNNFEIKVLNSVKADFKHLQKLKIEVERNKNEFKMYANGKKLMSGSIENWEEYSKIGVYHTDNIFKLYSVNAEYDKKSTFTDKFDKDSIRRNTVNATIEKKTE